jgi:hypothetical protein
MNSRKRCRENKKGCEERKESEKDVMKGRLSEKGEKVGR